MLYLKKLTHCFLILLFIALWPLSDGIAQTPPTASDPTLTIEDALPPVDEIFGTPEERETLQYAFKKRYVKAREKAEALLEVNPDSRAGLFVLALCFHYADSNLPRSLFLMRKLRKMVEDKAGAYPTDPYNNRWYYVILNELSDVAHEMDLREEELELLKKIESFYDEMTIGKQIYPLVKLKRFDEAQAAVQRAIQSGDEEQRAHGYNGQCWIDCDLGKRQECYESCKKACDVFNQDEVICVNAADSATMVFRFDETERLYRKATQLINNHYGSSWRDLALVYLRQSRIPEVMDALKRAQRQRMARPAHTDQQDQAAMNTAIAHLLISTGYAGEATQITRRAYEAPDRPGSISFSKEHLDFIGTYLHWTALKNEIESLKEQEGKKSWIQQLIPNPKIKNLEFERWRVKNHGLMLMSNERVMMDQIRPYINGANAMVEPWLAGGLGEFMGPGIFESALIRARKLENFPAAEAYFKAYEAELALNRGQNKKALELAEQTLTEIPKAEVLLKARLSAIAGEAAGRLGDKSKQQLLWSQALENFPVAFRLLSLQIPVRIAEDGSEFSHKLATMLKNSGRFKEDAQGFLIQIQRDQTQRGFEVRFYRQNETLHGSIVVEINQDQEKEKKQDAKKNLSLEEEAFDRFFEMLMSPKLDLSQSDINSLQGSLATGRARQQVEDALKNVSP